ncbi:MAG: membrane protein insertase YidC [Nitrospirae bacterium]|nr:membrane protein insertase YidC [Nitrospirota bacterium]
MQDNLDKKMLLALALSLVVLLVYQVFFTPPPPKKLPHAQKSAQQSVKSTNALQKKSLSATSSKISKEGLSPTKAVNEKKITIETPYYQAVLSTRGATIIGWKLKKYFDDKGQEIVLEKGSPKVPALAIGIDDNFSFGMVNFEVSPDTKKITLTNSGDSASIQFTYSDGQRLIKRTYTFYGNDYKVDVVEEVTGVPNYWLTLGTGFGISGTGGYRGHVGPVILKEADRKEIKPHKVKEPLVFNKDLKWIAQEDKYFFASIVPREKATAKVWRTRSGVVLTAINLPSGKNSYILYAGPKEHDRLKKLGVGLEHIVDFGFFSILARPLFWILKKLYALTGNYGWAIILLTIILRVPFIPLINKGQASMKKLQAIQPKMNEIRQKYKKDPQKMQKEMMELYKKHRVNPMGGCLPMLIQIPFFFALYKVLLVAIELRGAPFMLWIQDLSKKDPYYVLPIIMGITMYIQQKMTPTTADTQQQKIMQYLPVIFTFLFLSFPSGLVLYWLVTNILSIIQQYFVNRKLATQAIK